MTEKKEKKKLSGVSILCIIAFCVAVFVGFFWQRADCYVSGDSATPVKKIRLEIVVDFFNGVEYEKIIWE